MTARGSLLDPLRRDRFVGRIAMLRFDSGDVVAVDSQIHIWSDESPAMPWPETGRQYAHRDGSSPTAAELIADMDAVGVDRAILIPPSFTGYDNETSLRAAAAYPDRFAVMGRLPLEPGSPRPGLGVWRQTPGMLGIRLTFSRGDAQRWLNDGTADWVWDAAEAANVPLMVFIPERAAELRPIAKAHPTLRLIVDHAALPSRPPVRPPLDILDELLPLAEFENVAVKASALPSVKDEEYPFPTAQECTRRLVRAFGKERVFWGTDITRLKCTYREATTFLAEPGGLDSEALSWVMGRSLLNWLEWEVSSRAF